ncbi:MAG: hypothetical protein JWO95_1092 [Verrucomicrobiales bacterium]|nr:hypothetical protein [Verrucomicrobiales bacterium]
MPRSKRPRGKENEMRHLRIAERCAVDRQIHDQPWAVSMGSAGVARKSVVSLLPNCLWAFPGGKG